MKETSLLVARVGDSLLLDVEALKAMTVVVHERLAEKVESIFGQLGSVGAAGLEEQEKVDEMLLGDVGNDPSKRVKHDDGCT